MYRCSASSRWGELFGLAPTDLEMWQLKKISTHKLIEFATLDPRVEKIIGDFIGQSKSAAEVQLLKQLNDEEFNKLPYVKSKYNECIALNSADLESFNVGYRESRDDYVVWKRLSKENKSQEFMRWIDNKKSIIRPSYINFKWLGENHLWLVDIVIQKILSGSNDLIISTIPKLSKPYLLKYIERIFDLDKSIYIHSLSNIHTPRKYIIKSLREIARKKRVPTVRVILDKSILKELPSVMRLQTLESLLLYMKGGSVTFSDINSVDDLSELLFGTAIKYNDRVQQVMKRFKYLCT